MSLRNSWNKDKDDGSHHHVEDTTPPVPTTSDASSSGNSWGQKDRSTTDHQQIENRPFVHDHITQFPNAWSRYRATYLPASAGLLESPWECGYRGVYLADTLILQYVVPVFVPPVSFTRGLQVTLSLAVYRGFPWRKVPVYITAQLFGGIMGAAFVYWQYSHAINIYEGGNGARTLATAGLFATYAVRTILFVYTLILTITAQLDYMTAVSCFFSEFFATAVLLILIFAMTDKRNTPPPSGLAPLLLFILVLGIAAALGMQTGFAINPARDFGPRLLTSMVGYGKAVYTFRNQYWIWCPIMAPFLGALAGAGFYDLFLYTGEDSIFNRPNAAARRDDMHAAPQQRDNIPSGADAV
ncbi:hypothetical protein C0991_005841 [Blastosporella zonata]|nr:hypothetical protein C0991_005841 [Blastosporella zonata]